MASDAGRDPHHAGGMDEKAIRQAALVTLRRVSPINDLAVRHSLIPSASIPLVEWL
jgi:hypothetical protein